MIEDNEIRRRWRLLKPVVKCSLCFGSNFELKTNNADGLYLLCECGCQLDPRYLQDAFNHGFKKGKKKIEDKIKSALDMASFEYFEEEDDD